MHKDSQHKVFKSILDLTDVKQTQNQANDDAGRLAGELTSMRSNQ